MLEIRTLFEHISTPQEIIMTAITTTTNAIPGTAAGRGSVEARHARFWLAVSAVMVAAIGLAMITAGVVTGQPGLVFVASMATLAGGVSIVSAYSVYRKSLR